MSVKRPTCPTCTKPPRVCLCSRIRIPRIDNKTRVTILQHQLEAKHPLNSARIATLGFRNVIVHTVSDVSSRVELSIRFPETTPKEIGIDDTFDISTARDIATATIGKYGEIISLNSDWIPPNGNPKQSAFVDVLSSTEAREIPAKGFVVVKRENAKSKSSGDELRIGVPSGSVVLFPSERAVGAEEMKAMKMEIKNLIVLDGTWAKAKRVYKENPWLDLLPHLKLNLERESLYSEVRSQPKAGCLSTIESIVFALKAIGDNDEGLDELLRVFETMISDQRRCKYERLKGGNSSLPEMTNAKNKFNNL